MYQARALPSWPGQNRRVVVLPNNPRWCSEQPLLNPVTLTSGTWTTADTAVGFWIMAPETTTVYKIGWVNGSAAGGNTDVAIYASDGTTRLVSTGSTACSGNNVIQLVDTTDTVLTAGTKYFVAMNHSATTANQVQGTAAASTTNAAQLFAGVKVQAVGATALPDPFVPADPAAAVFVPTIVLQARSVF